jgi:hypothetical protein
MTSSRGFGRRVILTKSSAFLEYMKIHLISLNQDLEDARNAVEIAEDEYYESDAFYMGAIEATEHLLSVATDIMNSTNERNIINESGRHWTPATFTTFG